MSDASDDKCKGTRWDGWRWIGCGNPAKRDGYCGIHHPDAAAKRKAKSDAKAAERRAEWDASFKAKREVMRKAAAYDGLLAALMTAQAHLCGRLCMKHPDDKLSAWHHPDCAEAQGAIKRAREGEPL